MVNAKDHRHEWWGTDRMRACPCGLLQIRGTSGRWRRPTERERVILAAVIGFAFALRMVDLMTGRLR